MIKYVRNFSNFVFQVAIIGQLSRFSRKWKARGLFEEISSELQFFFSVYSRLLFLAVSEINSIQSTTL